MVDIISWINLDTHSNFGMLLILLRPRCLCYGACDLLGGDGWIMDVMFLVPNSALGALKLILVVLFVLSTLIIFLITS
jgi:hypothetical protein